MTSTVRYQGWLADSARWNGFAFRDDDILICWGCGTTWRTASRCPRQPGPDGHRAFVQEFLEGEFEADPTSGRLASVLHHLDTGWQRCPEAEVALLHYADLQADLPGELRRLADRLGYDLDEERAIELAAEASLDRMRARAKDAAPESSVGLWKDPQQSFRKGAPGDWREFLSDDDLDLYHRRVAAVDDEDMTMWLHGGRVGSGVDTG